MRILLVEDDDSVSTVLEKSLMGEHYAVDVVDDGQAGWQMVTSFDYDLIVLDVVLPKLDGIQFCQKLREHSYHMPVLLVTALNSSTQKIAGLDAGADDYLTKPFELEELLARVRVLLRRAKTPLLSLLEWGKLRLDPNSQEVTYRDRLIKLTPKEFRLLELFLRKPSQVFTRGAILDRLWGCGEVPGEDTVTAHIRGLRRKLADAGAPSDLIKTVYGIGYRLKPAKPSELQSSKSKSSSKSSRHTTVTPLDIEDSSLPADHEQQTQAALKTLWYTVKSQHLERLEQLQQMLRALRNKQLTDGLRQQATRAAHGLTGALGVFGLTSGSELARAIEQILATDAPIPPDSQKQLAELIQSLENELTQVIQHLEHPQSRSTAPLLVIIDDNLPLLQQVSQAVSAQGLAVQTALDTTALQKIWSKLTAAYRVSLSGEHSPATAKSAAPDIIFLNLALASSNGRTLRQLSRLINQVPPLLVLVCSPDGNLTSRVKAAQLGSQAFFQNANATAVVEGILKVRSRLPFAAQKLMVVDDDPQVLQALQTFLEPRGFQLITLNHPLDFWATLQTTAPDLLLLDIEMPKFNGLELCRAIRQTPVWNQLPIIFFTAHGDASTKAAALRAGANDLVEKSLPETTLLDRLFEQTKRLQLQQAISEITHQ